MAQFFYSFTYLYYSTCYLCKQYHFLLFVLLLDILPVIASYIKASIHISNFIMSTSEDIKLMTPIESFYSTISILPLLKHIMNCQENTPNISDDNIPQEINTTKDNNHCVFSYYAIAPIFLLLLLIMGIIVILSKKVFDNSAGKETVKVIKKRNTLKWCFRILFNFYDHFYFRALNLYICFILSNYVIYAIYVQHNILIIIISILMVFAIMIPFFYYFNKIFIYFKMTVPYPYDHFSSQFDTLLFIMKMLIAIESNLELQGDSALLYSSSMLYFSLIGLVLFLLFIIYQIIMLIFSEEHLIYYSNDSLNIIKFAVLIYAFLSIIFFSIFRMNKGYIFHILAHISLISLTTIISLILQYYRKVKIYRGKEINQLVYIIEHHCLLNKDAKNETYNTNCPIDDDDDDYYGTKTGEEEDDQKKSTKRNYILINELFKNIFIIHITKCNRITQSQCQLCSLYETLSFKTNDAFIEALFNGLYLQYKQNKTKTKNSWKDNTIDFIYHTIKSKQNFYLFSYSIVTAYNKFMNENKVLADNILVHYKQKIIRLKEMTTKVMSNLSVEIQINMINDILTEFEQTMFIRVINPVNIVTSAVKLNKLWKTIYKIVNRHENKVQYNSVIIKFILEKLFNKKIKHGGSIFDINSCEDMLQEDFERNRHITLSVNLISNRIVILSTGQEFNHKKQCDFEDIFMGAYEKLSMIKFNEHIKKCVDKENDNQIFSFPIKDFEHPDYVSSFKMKYLVLPTIDLNECLIVGLYSTNKDSIVISLQDKQIDDEILLYYSYNLKRDLIFPMEFMEQISLNKYSISIHKLFLFNEDNPNLIQLNYQRYNPFIKKIFTHMIPYQNIPSLEKRELALGALEIIDRHEKNKNKRKEMRLKHKIFIDIPQSNKTLAIYSFESEGKNNNFIMKNAKVVENNDNESFSSSHFGKVNNSTLGSTTMTAYSSTAGSSYFDNSASSLMLSLTRANSARWSIEVRDEIKEKKRQSRNFSLFTYFILAFNSILIILTILFLIIQIQGNSQFIRMFNFYILWVKLMRLFFNSTLNIFFNICTGKLNEITCANTFGEYEKMIIENSTTIPPDFSVRGYIFNELVIKADSLRSFLNEMNNEIYSMNEKAIINVIESDFQFRYLSIVEKNLTIKQDIYSFVNSLSVYLNLINMIMETDDYITKPIYILNINGPLIEDIELDNINLDAPLTPGQVTGYDIILNFPIYISTFYSLNDIVFNLLLRDIQSCKSVVLTFSIMITGIHFILMVLCFWFSNFFKMNLDTQMQEIANKIGDNVLKLDLQWKMIQLKKLAAFYQDSPRMMINIFDRREAKLKKSAKEKAKPGMISEQQEMQHMIKRRGKKGTLFKSESYHPILKSALNLLYGVFGSYFTYSIIFIILLMLSLADYSVLITTLNQNTTLDTSLSALTGLLQVTLLTNQTEEEMERYLNQTVIDMAKGFTQALVSNSFFALFVIQQEEVKPIVPKVDIMTCEFIYSKEMNDEIISKTNEKYLAYDYPILLVEICDTYEIMSLQKPKITIKDLIFRANQLLKQIEHDYDTLYALNNSFDMFNLYVIMIIIYRPMRNYETITLFIEQMDLLIVKNNWITYVYLCCNIIIELLLFLVIHEYVIQRYKLINKSMNRIINSIN